MPKKFKGENSKAAVAKERKQAAKQEADERKRRAEEDAYWKDDDKHAQRKQDRRAERDKKRQEQLDKKQEAKLLLAEEEAKIGAGKSSKGGGGGGAAKVTRAQIAEAEEQRRRESEASAGATALPKRLSIDEPTLELNPNREAQQRRMAGEIEARTVDEAIAVLSVGQEPKDSHPERRMKAAYAAYEERELPRLKEENPNLRMSQLKQLLRKEWMKSPENPMNQHHISHNAKTSTV